MLLLACFLFFFDVLNSVLIHVLGCATNEP